MTRRPRPRVRPIGVVGLGYVGLATAVAFAESGHRVVGYDVDEARLQDLREGKVPIYEPGLPELLDRHRRNGRLEFTDSLPETLERAEVLFLCLPTPAHTDGRIDLSFLGHASRQLGEALVSVQGWRLFVVKSTVVPGTATGVVGRCLEESSGKRLGKDFSVASNPEFLAEGTLVEDALRPARIVIGVLDHRSEAALRSCYARYRGPIVALPPAGAELIKYASNVMLALRVSFANEVSQMAESAGVDYELVRAAVGLDPRIGERFLIAGPGFGGSCFTKDLQALEAWARERTLASRLPTAALAVNDQQSLHVVDLAEAAVSSLNRRTVAMLGLSFKSGTSDTRGSRAYAILAELLRRGASVRLYDPEAAENFRRGLPSVLARRIGERVLFSPTLKTALSGADLALIHTDWAEFRRAPLALWKGLRTKVVIDARRTLDPDRLTRAGIDYRAVGLGVPASPQ